MIEYAGEIVTHENAHKLRGEYDLAKLRYFRFFICYSVSIIPEKTVEILIPG